MRQEFNLMHTHIHTFIHTLTQGQLSIASSHAGMFLGGGESKERKLRWTHETLNFQSWVFDSHLCPW